MTINTARSALSSVFGNIDGVPIGEHKLIVTFMKGVSKLRPACPRYDVTWNPDTVLSMLRTWPTQNCDLQKLTFKVVALLALVTGQRVQTLSSIKISEIFFWRPYSNQNQF